jgi:tRNA pseudouridine32 synthase/23S rRNA pseudouridine746 synthase/23S rRNA pseudouridine1911/1915/1917 synthase
MISKQPRNRHKPKGIEILYEDFDIIVVVKPCNLLTIGTDRDKSKTVHAILNDYVRKGDSRSRNRVYVVHRLDRETSGILLFARNENAKVILQGQWNSTEKHYLTIVHGIMREKQGTISSYLTENKAFTVFSTKDPTLGKLSHTAYRVLKETNGFSLLDINLLTGRKHQIRVHFSEHGHPVAGDLKYGKNHKTGGNLALHAVSISFFHPVNRKQMKFETDIPDRFLRIVGNVRPDV